MQSRFSHMLFIHRPRAAFKKKLPENFMVDALLFPCTSVYSMEELTSKQQKVLDYIRQGQQMKGQPPSLREIAKHMGVTLTAAADHVRALKRKGSLKAPANKARS